MKKKCIDLNKPRKQFWSEHIEQWKKSGLTQKKYCQQSSISYAGFCYWRTYLSKAERKVATERASPQPIFKQAKIASAVRNDLSLAPNSIKITLPNQARIEFSTFPGQAELVSLFQVLGGLA